MITPAVKNFCAKNEFFCEDHYADEAVMLRNAVPSAGGALAVGINATPIQMLGQKVLILLLVAGLDGLSGRSPLSTVLTIFSTFMILHIRLLDAFTTMRKP